MRVVGPGGGSTENGEISGGEKWTERLAAARIERRD